MMTDFLPCATHATFPAVDRVAGRALCIACVRKIQRDAEVACCLCHGALYLRNTRRSFPCLCTPEGRARINGRSDAEARAAIEESAA